MDTPTPLTADALRYDFQPRTVAHCLDRLAAGDLRTVIAAPPGTGKSVMQIDLQTELANRNLNCWIITSKWEIADGYLKKLGIDPSPDNHATNLVSTYGTFLNRLMEGKIHPFPDALIIDEAHHESADTIQQIQRALGDIPRFLFTATPFRGTAKSTKDFLERNGLPYWAITYQEAFERGIICRPQIDYLPLVDDDLIEIRNGEFTVSSVNNVTGSRITELVEVIRDNFLTGRGSVGQHDVIEYTTIDKPTFINVPSIEIGQQLLQTLGQYVDCSFITASTPLAARAQYFDECIKCERVLIEIDIMTEGIDYPFRRYIDFAPIFSPVKWAQKFGRLLRPGDGSEYICTNRNAERHLYLLSGMYPITAFTEVSAYFPPSSRRGNRVMGLETIGRLKPTQFLMANGLIADLWNLQSIEGNQVNQYAAIALPHRADPIWAIKTNTRTEIGRNSDGVIEFDTTWGKWERCDQPENLEGFSSAKKYALTDKQKALWTNRASFYGLDSDVNKLDSKNFQVLPILMDIRERLES